MAVDRKLTIAHLRGKCWLQFLSEIGNLDVSFSAICGGAISVTRSRDGRIYTVETDTDHIRVFVQIRTPDDLPAIYWRGGTSSYGWWAVDGYELREFPTGLVATDTAFQNADVIRTADQNTLGPKCEARRS